MGERKKIVSFLTISFMSLFLVAAKEHPFDVWLYSEFNRGTIEEGYDPSCQCSRIVHKGFLTQLEELARNDLYYVPTWATSVAVAQPFPNSSYFLPINYFPKVEKKVALTYILGMGEKVLEDGHVDSMRKQYERMVVEHEESYYHDQATNDSYAGYYNRLGDFAEHIMRHILSYQLKEGFKRAEKYSAPVRTFKKVRDTVRRVAKVTVNVEMSDTFKFGTKTDIPEQKANFWLTSDVVNGTLDFNFGEAWKPEEQTQNDLLNNVEVREFFLLTLKRTLFWSIDSTLTYGGTTSNFTATLSKRLTDQLTAQVSSSHGLDSSRTNLPPGGEERVSFHYTIGF